MSANQLLAVELGLYLLSQLCPSEPFSALPDLISNGRQDLTGKQLRYLARGRLLLSQIIDSTTWLTMVERYISLPEHLCVYEANPDRTFTVKRHGFSHNRVFTLKRLFEPEPQTTK